LSERNRTGWLLQGLSATARGPECLAVSRATLLWLDPFSEHAGQTLCGLFGSTAPVRRDCLPGILARTYASVLDLRTEARRPTLVRLSSTSGLDRQPAPQCPSHAGARVLHRGHPRGVSAPKAFWYDRQLNPRNVHSRSYVSPVGFLNLMGGHPGSYRRAVCFTRPALLGFRLPGACASGAVHLSMNLFALLSLLLGSLPF